LMIIGTKRIVYVRGYFDSGCVFYSFTVITQIVSYLSGKLFEIFFVRNVPGLPSK
jgi:hypothetical protein